MVTGESKCADCSWALTDDARFCSNCGLPLVAAIGDDLRADPATGTTGTTAAPGFERTRLVTTVAVLAGLVLIIWSIIATTGADAESVGSTTTEASAIAPTTTITAPTTSAESATPSLTSGPKGPIYVNGTQGPVLGEGVAGVAFGVDANRLTRIDLATGEITYLETSLPSFDQVISVFDGGVWLSTSSFLRTIDLTTGTASEPRSFGTEGDRGSHVLGLASQATVWIVSSDEFSSTVRELDATGQTMRSFEFDAPFWVRSAIGQTLFLEGPYSSWVFDTATSAISDLGGMFIDSESGAIVVLSCDSISDCRVSIDTGQGLSPTEALTVADVAEGEVRINEAMSGALIQRWSSEFQDAYEVTYVDLETRERVELGVLPIDEYAELMWLPETPWILASTTLREVDLLAINTETGTTIELRVRPGRGAKSVGWFLAPPSHTTN